MATSIFYDREEVVAQSIAATVGDPKPRESQREYATRACAAIQVEAMKRASIGDQVADALARDFGIAGHHGSPTRQSATPAGPDLGDQVADALEAEGWK